MSRGEKKKYVKEDSTLHDLMKTGKKEKRTKEIGEEKRGHKTTC